MFLLTTLSKVELSFAFLLVVSSKLTKSIPETTQSNPGRLQAQDRSGPSGNEPISVLFFARSLKNEQLTSQQMKGQKMSNTVSKPGVSKTLVALASAVLLGLSGLYLYSNYGHLLAQWSATEEVAAPAHFAQSDEDRAKEYAEFKKGFFAKVETYKSTLAEPENAEAIRTLKGLMDELAVIEAAFIELRPRATEPDKEKLDKMVVNYGKILFKINELSYQLVGIRDARWEVYNVHALLKFTSPVLYEADKDEIKKLLRAVDPGTLNIYDAGNLLSKIEYLTQIALQRIKPEEQEATPEMMRNAHMHAVQLYLNQLTSLNAPPQREGE